MNTKCGTDEIRLAKEIVSVLPAGVARLCSNDSETIRYAVAGDGLKLKAIVLSRESLRRLLNDPACSVKVDYLQRDLLRNAVRRAEFRYPRVTQTGRRARRRAAALAMASIV